MTDDPDYIEARRSRSHHLWATLPFAKKQKKPEQVGVACSWHSEEYVERANPYQAQCVAPNRRLRARRASTPQHCYSLPSPSASAMAETLPDKTIDALPRMALRRLAVGRPGFSADLLEPLEEIRVKNAEIFSTMALAHFAFIPCLNDSEPAWT